MAAEESFQTLKEFFETRDAANQALQLLPDGHEISIVIGDTVQCAIFRENGTPKVENRVANEPLFHVYLRPETVDVISQNTKDDFAEIALCVLKEAIAGNLRVAIGTRVISDVMSFVPKILSLIKQMRS